jgi:NADH:ubiquinone oxidoreductase subunit E
VQCLAACDIAPAIKINDELYGNVSDEKIDALLESLLARA